MSDTKEKRHEHGTADRAKRGGWMVHQESEHRIVPMKVGNRTLAGPTGGKADAGVMELRKGNTTRDAKLD